MKFNVIATALATLWLTATVSAAPSVEREKRALPIIQDPSKFKFYDLPDPLSGPCDLCEGPDGAVWGSDQIAPYLFRLDPATGNVETFLIPYTVPQLNVTFPPALSDGLGHTALACAVRPGADGNIYAATGTRDQLVRINPTTKKIDIFGPLNLAGDAEPFNDLYTSPTGMYFTQTTANKVSFFSFKTEQITSVTPPTALSNPLGMYYASDGFAYFTEFQANKIGQLNPTTGQIKEFPVPLGAATPAVIRVETENPGQAHPYIWFTALVPNSVGRLNPNTGAVDVYTSPFVGGLSTENTKDCNGNVWFSEFTQNILAKIDGNTKQITGVEIPGTFLPTPVSVPPLIVIAVNYGPGNAIWFQSESFAKVGRYSLD